MRCRAAHHPPTVPFPAAVRVVVASPGAKPQLVSQYLTQVQPLMFVTGKGPWRLDPGGAWSFILEDKTVFLWLDPATSREVSLVAARLRDPKPTVLVPDSFETLWVPSAGSNGSSVVLNAYRSGPDFRRFEVGCTAPRWATSWQLAEFRLFRPLRLLRLSIMLSA